MKNFIDYAKQKEQDFTKIPQAENDLITYKTLREYYDDWVKLRLYYVISSFIKGLFKKKSNLEKQYPDYFEKYKKHYL